VLPKKFLPNEAAIMIPKTDDGRVLFAIPWHDRVIIGTTDTPTQSICLEPLSFHEERDFLMTHINKYLNIKIQPRDVCSIFVGLRPLVKPGSKENASTASISREHSILIGKSGLITLTGGKWTTYRKMAKDVVDTAENIAGLLHQESITKHLHIHGWTQLSQNEKNLEVYGSDATEIKMLLDTNKDYKEKIHPELPYQQGEVIWQARNEMAFCVNDILSRRTRALLLNANAAREAAPLVASLMAKELGKDSNWEKEQIENFSEVAERYDFNSPRSIQ
jgi:glycerol-3-phosphate dehydrogenase